MAYLFSTFWLWLFLAFLLGLVVGSITCRRQYDIQWRTLRPWIIGISIAALVAVFRLLPDRIGYWFDLGVLMVFLYFIGCLLACLWQKLRASATAPAGMAAPVMQKMAASPAVAHPVAAPPVAAPAPVAKPVAAAATPAVEQAVEPGKPADVMEEAPEEAITGLSGPRSGRADDLKKVYGIDAETEKKLNGLGIYHYDQLASLSPGQRRWLFRQLGYEGRFPSWWWRWRYDAEKLAAGGAIAAVSAAPAPLAAAIPAAPAQAEDAFEGSKPSTLAAPRGGKADDLKRIKGIGKQNEGRLHGLGIWHFDQIAAWTADEVKWVGGYLAFAGRIEREGWVDQAKVLASGGETDFSKRADAGKVATSRDDSGDDGQNNIAVLGKDFTSKPGANDKKDK